MNFNEALSESMLQTGFDQTEIDSVIFNLENFPKSFTSRLVDATVAANKLLLPVQPKLVPRIEVQVEIQSSDAVDISDNQLLSWLRETMQSKSFAMVDVANHYKLVSKRRITYLLSCLCKRRKLVPKGECLARTYTLS